MPASGAAADERAIGDETVCEAVCEEGRSQWARNRQSRIVFGGHEPSFEENEHGGAQSCVVLS